MQYFRPEEPFFVGDCMPFYHDGIFHLYYLLDENHHQGRGGLGGHQWAHASTTDLVHWTHHPLALPIEHDWEASICTGSVFYHDGAYYAFYPTRLADRSEHLSLAVSRDGIHFTKTEPNPFASPEPPYRKGPFRDPMVFAGPPDGVFHMIVTAELADYPLAGRGGCLAHFTSTDLRHWQHAGQFLVPGYVGHQPECADYFEWHGWYYLLFSDVGQTHYRMSRNPLGPWQRPRSDLLDGAKASVMKTAAFSGDRRIGAAFITSPLPHAWAGHTLFRELVQHADGTLGTKFAAEMIPQSGEPLPLRFAALTSAATQEGQGVSLSAPEGLAVAALAGGPRNFRLTTTVRPEPGTATYGLCVRGTAGFSEGRLLRFEPSRGKVSWTSPRSPAISAFRQSGADEQERSALYEVTGLDEPFSLDLILRDDILDLCIDNRRTLVDRIPDLPGNEIFLACWNGRVRFDHLQVRELER